jgi:UDP-glucose 4-epimerase
MKNGIKNIIFISSVAVYGLNKINPAETHPAGFVNEKKDDIVFISE